MPGAEPTSLGQYLMCGGLTTVNFPKFANDVQLVQALLAEENMLILPGSCFRYVLLMSLFRHSSSLSPLLSVSKASFGS